MSIITTGLVIGAVLCAIQALQAKRLLASAVWLAGVSALLSITLYLLGAHEVAVIELSVGAGLVTVLFVFAISIAGEEAINAPALIPRPLAWGLVILSVLLLGWQVLPVVSISSPFSEPPFASVLWQGRGLDVLVQIVLVFAGVLGVLGLLAEAREPAETYAGEGAKAEARAAQPLPDLSPVAQPRSDGRPPAPELTIPEEVRVP